MHELAVTLRTAQHTAHLMHHVIRGTTFLANHEWLGELYQTYEAAYDKTVERMIGAGNTPDECAINKDAAARCADFNGSTPEEMFRALIVIEEQLRTWCTVLTPTASLGQQNMLAQFADDSEDRDYKLKRLVA